MADTPITPQPLSEKLYGNFLVAAKSLSSYVVLLATAAGGYWLSLTPAEQAAFVAAHPILVNYGPYLTPAAWAIAKLWPQKAVTNQVLENASK